MSHGTQSEPRPAAPAGLAAPTVSMAGVPTPAVLPPLPPDPSRPASVAFVLLLPGKSGAVFLQRGRAAVLPLFTGWDRAAAFQVAARMTRCWIQCCRRRGPVADFLRSPPGRPGSAAALHVAVDPAGPMVRADDMIPAAVVIDALRTDPR